VKPSKQDEGAPLLPQHAPYRYPARRLASKRETVPVLALGPVDDDDDEDGSNTVKVQVQVQVQVQGEGEVGSQSTSKIRSNPSSPDEARSRGTPAAAVAPLGSPKGSPDNSSKNLSSSSSCSPRYSTPRGASLSSARGLPLTPERATEFDVVFSEVRFRELVVRIFSSLLNYPCVCVCIVIIVRRMSGSAWRSPSCRGLWWLRCGRTGPGTAEA
jgi:hypothetical protein